MPPPIILLNAIVIGFGIAGTFAAICFCLVRRSFWPPFLFALTSIGFSGYALFNLGLQTTTDPAAAIEYFRYMDLFAIMVLVVAPYLFRRLLGQRIFWVDHVIAVSLFSTALISLFRATGYWNSIREMAPIDLGWWGMIYQPIGEMSRLRILVQVVCITSFVYLAVIGIRAGRKHHMMARALVILPLILIPSVIYQVGLFKNWWRGPMLAPYTGLAIYLILAAMIFERDRDLLQERDNLFRTLTEREQKLSALTNFSVGFAGLLDPEGRVVLANHASLAAIGATAESVVNKPFPETPWWSHDAAQQDRLRLAIAQAAKGQPDRFQATHKSKAGDEITVDFSLTPYRSEDGTLRYLIAEGRDITALVKYQERLREGHRLEAVGQLAGGVAHDFNNVLGGIMSATELALLRVEKNEDVKQHLGMILRSANRAADLTRNLLSFSRRGKSQETNFGVNSLSRDTLAVLGRTLGPSVRIESKLDAQPDQIRGDPSEIQSAVLNLCLNARDAMPRGGTLTLTTARVTLDAARAEQLPQQVAPGEYVTIAIRDSGEGIAPDLQQRIFEPFFTTKAAGHGTGLGLAAVLGAAQAHNGAVDLRSGIGQGALFTLYLPALAKEKTTPEAEPAALQPPPPANRGAAMVVDDEALVRELTAEMLRQVGFTVQAFRDPIQARGAIANLADTRLIVLDLAMPNLDGVSLFHEVRRQSKTVAVIIATGFAGDRLQALDDPHLATLAKPFRLVQLTDALKRLGV